LATQCEQNYKSFTHLAYYAPFYALIDKKAGKGTSTDDSAYSNKWLRTNFEAIKNRSDQYSETIGLLEIWFPKNVFVRAKRIAGEIDGQVDDYNTMIKENKSNTRQYFEQYKET
jgi:hypothetical protein